MRMTFTDGQFLLLFLFFPVLCRTTSHNRIDAPADTFHHHHRYTSSLQNSSSSSSGRNAASKYQVRWRRGRAPKNWEIRSIFAKLSHWPFNLLPEDNNNNYSLSLSSSITGWYLLGLVPLLLPLLPLPLNKYPLSWRKLPRALPTEKNWSKFNGGRSVAICNEYELLLFLLWVGGCSECLECVSRRNEFELHLFPINGSN